MNSEWRTPQSEVVLSGSVQYRCHSCGELMPEEWTVFVGAGKETRTYHPDHVPEKGLIDGR